MFEDHAFRGMRLTGAYIITFAGGFSTGIYHFILSRLTGQDLRFSVKMMFAPDPDTPLQPV